MRKPIKRFIDIIKKYDLIPIDEEGGGGTQIEDTEEFESGGYRVRYMKLPPDRTYPGMILTISQNPSKPDYSAVVDELERYNNSCRCLSPFDPFHSGTEHAIIHVDVVLGYKSSSWVADRRFEIYDPKDGIWAKIQLSWMLYDWYIDLKKPKKRGPGRPKKEQPTDEKPKRGRPPKVAA